MAKHNLELEPEEGYELVQVISEEKGKTCLSLSFLPFHTAKQTHSLLFPRLQWEVGGVDNDFCTAVDP